LFSFACRKKRTKEKGTMLTREEKNTRIIRRCYLMRQGGRLRMEQVADLPWNAP
jgi:hypothetical protein